VVNTNRGSQPKNKSAVASAAALFWSLVAGPSSGRLGDGRMRLKTTILFAVKSFLIT
jgi:hypothetical protein